MSDEMELLRRFRDETPGPSTDAWIRARTAIAAAAAEQAEIPSSSTEEAPRTRLGTRRTPRRWRTGVVLAATAAVVVLVVSVFVAVGGNSPSAGPMTTPWHAARSLPSAGHLPLPRRTTGSWQLVDDLVSSGWRQNTTGPPPGALTCPDMSACYALGGAYASANGNAPLLSESLYISSDFGLQWSVLPLPTGFSPSTKLVCPDVLDCSVAGVMANEPVFLTTSDGGHQWTVRPLTVNGGLSDLTCVTPTVCSALAPSVGRNALLPHASTGPLPMEMLARTTDGGVSWTTSDVPSGFWLIQISCASSTSCLGVGATTGAGSASHPSGVVLRTSDGGQNWSAALATHGFPLYAVTCPTVSTCWAVGEGAGGSEPFVSDDGGATWVERPFPRTVPEPEIADIACPSSTECWLTGTEAVPQTLQVGRSSIDDGGSAVILGMADGTGTWEKVTFTVPPGAPNYDGQSYMSVGSISCPTTSACIALGVVAQGSPTTPVYSFGSNRQP